MFSTGTQTSSHNPQPMQVSLTGDSKLAEAVNVSLLICLYV